MNEILINVWTVLSTIGAVIFKIMDWIKKHEAQLLVIMTRVEKDKKDGWTNKEKVDYAWELFKQKIYPDLNFMVRGFIRVYGEKKIKAIFINKLNELVGKTRVLKGAVDLSKLGVRN